MGQLLKPSLNWMLIFFPVCVFLELTYPDAHSLIFLSSCAAIVPLAGLLGKATEHIADSAGEGLGGFLNATLGNAAELIIAIVAMRQGLTDVVKASITGSIIGNVLLVLGMAFLAGGIRHKTQEYNASAAQAQVASLVLVTVGLIVPGAFERLSQGTMAGTVSKLSVTISIVLLLTYALNLVFSLYTHKELFSGSLAASADSHSSTESHWGLRLSIVVLAVSTVLIAWMSEILVGSVSEAAKTLGMSNIFIGVIVVAMVGNAAEHSSAVTVAIKNRMDLSLSIALGSSVQIALFVAPFLVLLSYAIAPAPMDLVFSPVEILAVILGVSICGHVMNRGQSNWFVGALLLAVYVILGLAFFFVPTT